MLTTVLRLPRLRSPATLAVLIGLLSMAWHVRQGSCKLFPADPFVVPEPGHFEKAVFDVFTALPDRLDSVDNLLSQKCPTFGKLANVTMRIHGLTTALYLHDVECTPLDSHTLGCDFTIGVYWLRLAIDGVDVKGEVFVNPVEVRMKATFARTAVKTEPHLSDVTKLYTYKLYDGLDSAVLRQQIANCISTRLALVEKRLEQMLADAYYLR